MKKVMMTMMAVLFAIAANAQYNVGTSSKYTDPFGNSTTNQKSNNENTTIWSW